MMDRAQKKKLYLTSLMVSVVATAIGSGAMGVMLSSIIDAYDLQTAQEGYMSSCISAGALAALLGGILLRGRVSKPAFIFWGGTLMSVMLLLKGTAIPFGVFLAVCTAMGLGMGVMDSFQSAFLADLIPERSAQGLGVLHGIFGVGGFALPLALHRLLAGHGWRQVYVMIGLVCLALMLQFGLASRKMAHDRLFAVKLETSGNFSQIRNFIKQPYFFVLLLCIFLGAAAQNGVLVWTVRYVSGTLKSEALAPLCLSLFWIASTVSRVMTPSLPVRPSAVLAAGSALTAAVWTAGIVSENAVMMLICCIIGGLGSGCCIPVLLSEGAAFSPENTGLITSILMIVKTIGQILMPLAVSAIRASTGETAGMLLIAAAFLADAVAVAGLIYVKKKEK